MDVVALLTEMGGGTLVKLPDSVEIVRFVTAATVTTEMFVVPKVIVEGPPVKEGVTAAVALERGYGVVEEVVWLA